MFLYYLFLTQRVLRFVFASNSVNFVCHGIADMSHNKPLLAQSGAFDTLYG